MDISISLAIGLILTGVVFLFLTANPTMAWAESGGAKELFINIRTPQVKTLLAEAAQVGEQSDLILLDVRHPDEYAAGHIPGAILIPLLELSDRLQELDRKKRILVICRMGSRSARASQILVDAGFERVFNYAGGMMSWDGQVVTGEKP